jgi:flagellar hook-associated protein 2
MLKGDALLQGIYSGFRNAFISPIKDPTNTSANLNVALGDIGITTGNYTDRGKLTIDETKLRQALAQNPQDVINFFTAKSTINYSENLTSDQRAQRNSESGVAFRISDIINDNIRKTLNSSGQEGLLLEAAGIDDDVTYVKNAINTKINSVDSGITKLNDSLSMYEKRYYAQFTAMEQAVDKMNSQSSYISSFFGQNN